MSLCNYSVFERNTTVSGSVRLIFSSVCGLLCKSIFPEVKCFLFDWYKAGWNIKISHQFYTGWPIKISGSQEPGKELNWVSFELNVSQFLPSIVVSIISTKIIVMFVNENKIKENTTSTISSYKFFSYNFDVITWSEQIDQL